MKTDAKQCSHYRRSRCARRCALISLVAIVAACTTSKGGGVAISEARGASLRLVSISKLHATFALGNSASEALAYEHWMSQGPEPVPYCRDPQGSVRICALRIYLTPENDPNVHESYLQPGDSVRFRAVPSKDEQVGVRLWFHGKDEFLWFVHWTPNTSWSAHARNDVPDSRNSARDAQFNR